MDAREETMPSGDRLTESLSAACVIAAGIAVATGGRALGFLVRESVSLSHYRWHRAHALVALVLFAVSALLWRAFRLQGEMPPLRPRRFWRDVGWAGAVFVGATAVLVGASSLLKHDGGAPDGAFRLVGLVQRLPHGALDALLQVTLVCLVAPVAEEVFYRGVVLSVLCRRLHVALAVGIQAILFVGAHTFDLPRAIYLLFIGVATAVLRLWRKSLFPSIVLHCLVNGLALGVSWAAPHLLYDKTQVEVTREVFSRVFAEYDKPEVQRKLKEIEALQGMPPEEAVQGLRAYLSDESIFVAGSAGDALARMGSHGEALYAEILRSGSALEKERVLDSLSLDPNPGFVESHAPEIARLIVSEQGKLRIRAYTTLLSPRNGALHPPGWRPDFSGDDRRSRQRDLDEWQSWWDARTAKAAAGRMQAPADR